jgi:hypothetical protein
MDSGSSYVHWFYRLLPFTQLLCRISLSSSVYVPSVISHNPLEWRIFLTQAVPDYQHGFILNFPIVLFFCPF